MHNTKKWLDSEYHVLYFYLYFAEHFLRANIRVHVACMWRYNLIGKNDFNNFFPIYKEEGGHPLENWSSSSNIIRFCVILSSMSLLHEKKHIWQLEKVF